MNPNHGNLERKEPTIFVMLQDKSMPFRKSWLIIYQRTSKFHFSFQMNTQSSLIIREDNHQKLLVSELVSSWHRILAQVCFRSCCWWWFLRQENEIADTPLELNVGNLFHGTQSPTRCLHFSLSLLLCCLYGLRKLFWSCCGRKLLHKYANEDVSLGAWFIGLEVEHVDEKRLCCGSTSGNLFWENINLS